MFSKNKQNLSIEITSQDCLLLKHRLANTYFVKTSNYLGAIYKKFPHKITKN